MKLLMLILTGMIIIPVYAVRLNQDGLMLFYGIKNIIESPKEIVIKHRYRASRKKYKKLLHQRGDKSLPKNTCEEKCPRSFSLLAEGKKNSSQN